MILDGASWHNSHGLMVPGNITLLALPPYSPELNPVERIWHYLRSLRSTGPTAPTLTPKNSGSQETPRWRNQDSNRESLSQRTRPQA